MMNATSWQMTVFLSYINPNPTCSASPYECPMEKRIYLINKCDIEIRKCTELQKAVNRKLSELRSRRYMLDKDGVHKKGIDEQTHEVKKLLQEVQVRKLVMDKVEEEILKSRCAEA